MGKAEERSNVSVKLKPEVEELVRQVAKFTGYMPYTVRNAAVLYGLQVLASTRGVPKSDWEFILLVDNTKRTVNRVVWGLRGGRSGKKR